MIFGLQKHEGLTETHKKRQAHGLRMPSERAERISASGTVRFFEKVCDMRRRGREIISFTLGEPDFTTPEPIMRAAAEAMMSGKTHYTQSGGIPELRDAVASAAREEGVPCSQENVLITPAKHALFVACMALFNRGDRVLIPDPGWVSYEAMLRLADAEPVRYPLRKGDFHLDLEVLEGLMDSRIRGIIVNNPSNPTGAVYSRDELASLLRLAREHDLYVISDEIYSRIVYDVEHRRFASLPGAFDRTVTVDGVSKSFAMTGWRIGWAIAPDEVIQAMMKIHQHSITCATSFAQYGALEALRSGDRFVREMVESFRRRRDLTVRLLRDIDGIECREPEGTFYAFPSFDLPLTSQDFCDRLLEISGVAVIPGSVFGASGEGHFRLSFASSEEDLVRGIELLGRAVEVMDQKP
jgi:aspartate aminotransferase